MNRVSLKDNYPLPKMDHILQKVVGSQKCQCWMVSLGTIKSWYTLMIRKRQHLQHHGAPSCMPRFFWAHECRSNISKGYGYSFC
nr:hypothetical protein Q903MT_gene1746 [Picea sitchensis]